MIYFSSLPNTFIPSAANQVLIDFTSGTQVSVIAGSGDSQICVHMTVNSIKDTIGDRVVMVNYTMRDESATGMLTLYNVGTAVVTLKLVGSLVFSKAVTKIPFDKAFIMYRYLKLIF